MEPLLLRNITDAKREIEAVQGCNNIAGLQSIGFDFIELILLKYRNLKNVIHQTDCKNEWLLLSVSFTARFEFVFVLTQEKALS